MTQNEQTAVSPEQYEKAIREMAAVGVLGNVFLAIFKLIAGIFGHSAAMLSDAVHTLSDVFATLIAFIGVQLSKKKADREHPYGHERLECVASLLLGSILLLTGAGIGINCLKAIISGSYKELEQPGMIAVAAAIVSILTKEAMFWYTMYNAKRCKSSAFKADAWHHRSDALSSVGALIGIEGARRGFPILDQVAGIVICIVIIGVAVSIFKDAISKMLDTSCDDDFEDNLKQFVKKSASDLGKNVGIDILRTRKFGEKIYAEMEISADGNMSLKEAHDIADVLHDKIEEKYPDIKHIMIHMNPAGYSYKTPTSL